MDVFGWIVLICVFTPAFGRKCQSGFYWEHGKGCTSCGNICNIRPTAECSFYCPGWSSEPAQDVPMQDVPDGSPPDDIPDTPDASSVNLPAILIPIACIFACIFVLVSAVVGGRKIYKRRQGRGNINPGNNPIPLMDMPEVIVQPHAQQVPEGVPNLQDEENSDDAVSAAFQGPETSDAETSSTGSRLSQCRLTEEASQDVKRDAFCSGESNLGLAQMIMNTMPDTDPGKFTTPHSQNNDGESTTDPKYMSTPTPDVDLPLEEFKGTGKGARPKEPKAPTQVKDSPESLKLSRVRLEKEGGGHRNLLWVESTSQDMQESPDQMLYDTTAVGQPMSKEDPTAKPFLGEQTNTEPYRTQLLNDLQPPTAQGQVPNGVDTYRHDDVNARYGGTSHVPVHRPNNERRPSQNEPPR